MPHTPTPATRDQRYATTLAHGLDLLRSFRVGEPVLSNRQFAERTGLSKATVSRLTYTLAEIGFLRYDAELRQYRLGSAALAVGYPLLASLRIRQLARPWMKDLADFSRGSVSLGMRDRTHMVYIESTRGHDSAAFRPDIGASLPIVQSAMGHAWMARAEPAERMRVEGLIREGQPGLWSRHAPGLQQNLAQFAQRGFCVSRGDWRDEIHAVAVPLSQPVDGEILVFNCGIPSFQVGEGLLDKEIGPRLRLLVRQVEAALGLG